MALLVLGPLLRFIAESAATIWVETDAPCTVEVCLTALGGTIGASARTFTVRGHHYALAVADGLEPGTSYEYTLALDGERVWPQPDSPFPTSTIRTLAPGTPLRVAFGSCRQAAPHAEPYTLPRGRDARARGIDALHAYTHRMLGDPDCAWPELLLLLGDQVYADETSPHTRDVIRARRDPRRPPGYGVADFEEYTTLYQEAWSEPAVRWLLSTVPSTMIFDDHDVHDDWNTSAAWVEHMRAQPWWQARITGGLMAYWLYQHLGNLTPEELAGDELLARVQAADDGGDALAAFAALADRDPAANGIRWSFRRDLGRTRLVEIDSRCGRVLDGRRDMLDEPEWSWLEEQLTGDVDHLLIATSLPFLLPPAVHDVEAWNEAVCAGAWGARAARLGERMRQGSDLEHWAAFGRSFERLAARIEAVAAGRHGQAPASIVLLSGDVHHAYVAEVSFPPERGVRSRVVQAVCSPLRNPAERRLRMANQLASTRLGAWIGRTLAARAGVGRAPLDWRVTQGPFYDNQIATLELDGRHARLRVEKTLPDARAADRLETVLEQRLTGEHASEPVGP